MTVRLAYPRCTGVNESKRNISKHFVTEVRLLRIAAFRCELIRSVADTLVCIPDRDSVAPALSSLRVQYIQPARNKRRFIHSVCDKYHES